MRLLIADDHAMIRQGLKRILAEAFPRAEFGEAGTVSETVTCLQQAPWDILLLDIFMPGGGGLEVLKGIAALPKRPAVLILTSAPEDQFAVRMLQAGAAGYLEKRAVGEELVKAIRQLAAGHTYLSSRVAERLVHSLNHPRPGRAPHEGLSAREFQVLQLLASGRPQKEIAATLGVSPKTISTFRRRILKKLHLENDLGIIQYALEHRLLERPGSTRAASV